MFGFRRWLRNRSPYNRLRSSLFLGTGPRERAQREEFFFNAFRALAFNGIDGDYAEFGCHGATTFDLAHHQARRHGHDAHLWAFDSFAGLPDSDDAADEHPSWIGGRLATSLEDFHALCRANGIPRDAYSCVPGFYEESLPALGATGGPTNIALAYVDCDLYSSTRSVLAFLRTRLKHGMIVAFDDYFCWSSTQLAGNRRALEEAFPDDDPEWRMLSYHTFGWHGASFVVESKAIAATPVNVTARAA